MDVDHHATALPDLAAVTLYFDPEQQHQATVPAGIQVELEVALSACIKWKGRDEKDIIHPQVIVELFERLAVNKLSSRVILMSYLEARARVHTNLRPFLPCVLRLLQSSQKFLDVEGRQLFVLSI